MYYLRSYMLIFETLKNSLRFLVVVIFLMAFFTDMMLCSLSPIKLRIILAS